MLWEEIEIIYELRCIKNILIEIRDNQPRFLPYNIIVKWSVDNQMGTQPISLNLDATAKAVGVVAELNSDGSVFTYNPANIQVAVQDNTVVSAIVDPATGDVTVTPLKVGSTQVVVQDSVTGITSPAYTFTVSQTGPTPSSLSVTWTVTP